MSHDTDGKEIVSLYVLGGYCILYMLKLQLTTLPGLIARVFRDAPVTNGRIHLAIPFVFSGLR